MTEREMVKKKPLTEVEKINREINELEDRVFRYLVKGVDSTKGFGKNLKNIFDPEKGILKRRNTHCGSRDWAYRIENILNHWEEAELGWSEQDRELVFDAMFSAGVIWGQFLERGSIDRGYAPFSSGRKGGQKRGIPREEREARAKTLNELYNKIIEFSNHNLPLKHCIAVAKEYSKISRKPLGQKRIYDELKKFGYILPKKKRNQGP